MRRSDCRLQGDIIAAEPKSRGQNWARANQSAVTPSARPVWQAGVPAPASVRWALIPASAHASGAGDGNHCQPFVWQERPVSRTSPILTLCPRCTRYKLQLPRPLLFLSTKHPQQPHPLHPLTPVLQPKLLSTDSLYPTLASSFTSPPHSSHNEVLRHPRCRCWCLCRPDPRFLRCKCRLLCLHPSKHH